MNKAFCILPWVGLHVNPDGEVFPCCSSDYQMPYGNVNSGESLNNIYKNGEFHRVRRMMLNGERPKQCQICYNEEKNSGWSSRLGFNDSYKEEVEKTKLPLSGAKRIQMLDIRFSNICNMKCRMCSSGFSSLWAQEDKQRGIGDKTILRVDESFIDQIIEILPSIDHIYFAGGEPLIMDEHYRILEEIQRQNLASKIFLRYSSNLSVTQYKTKDLLSLWKGFVKVDFAASIDHYGERAEYIRHGTDWSTVEKNLIKMLDEENVDLSISSTINVFNYTTFLDFCKYMEKYFKDLNYLQMYPMSTPEYLSSQILPKHIKDAGTQNWNQLSTIRSLGHLSEHDITGYANAEHTWEQEKENFQKEVSTLDKIRGEDFCKTFPELAEMMDG
jgi:radical SAM protein with 4Fe4S-binding SPASM domain